MKIGLSWSPSANLYKQIHGQPPSPQLQSLFVNELAFDLKNGLAGGKLQPAQIVVDGAAEA